MNVLVTGGLGFIGHVVSRRLIEAGHDVVIVDNQTTYGTFSSYETSALMQARLQVLQKTGGFTLYVKDVCNTSAIEQIMERHAIEAVIHLASFPRQRIVNKYPQRGSAVMSAGLIGLLEASAKLGVEGFVYVSSSMVYGSWKGEVNEQSPCHPEGQYAILKLAGEWLTNDYARRCGFSAVIVRPSTVYGPLDIVDRVIAKFMDAATRDGVLHVHGPDEFIQPTYVEDAAQGIVGALLSGAQGTYNVAAYRAISLLSAAQLVVDTVGRGCIKLHNRDLRYPSRGRMSIQRAQNDLCLPPTTGVEDGFQLYFDRLQA